VCSLQLKDKAYDKARIRVEAVIRKQNENAGEDVLEIMCELLSERINLIATEKVLPADLSESVHTLVWAAMRTQVDELRIVKEQLIHRYGAVGKDDKLVNPDVKERLAAGTPDVEAKLSELESIAAEYQVGPGGCCGSLARSPINCAHILAAGRL
jgi:hypothetical protein